MKSGTTNAPEKNKIQPIEIDAEPHEKGKKTIPILWAESPVSETVETEHDARAKRAERRDRWKLLFEGLTLFAVGGYGLVAFWQWREVIRSNDFTRQTLEETKRSNELSLRSLVAITGLHGPSVVAIKTQKVPFSIIIQNVGKVPARDMTFVGPNEQFIPKLYSPFHVGDPAELFSPENQGTDVLAPGASMEKPLNNEVGPVNESRWKEITSKQIFFLILGAVRYSDAFGKNWFTVWCYFYDVDSEQFRACPGGNIYS